MGQTYALMLWGKRSQCIPTLSALCKKDQVMSSFFQLKDTVIGTSITAARYNSPKWTSNWQPILALYISEATSVLWGLFMCRKIPDTSKLFPHWFLKAIPWLYYFSMNWSLWKESVKQLLTVEINIGLSAEISSSKFTFLASKINSFHNYNEQLFNQRRQKQGSVISV